MKVFISSVIRGYESYRAAAREAIETLGHQAVGAEDFASAPGTPQQACLAGVRQADVVVFLVGERYGDPLASGLSATQEEYEEARGRKPILLLVEAGVEPEAAQQGFLDQVQNWATGHIRTPYSSASELQKRVFRAIHEYELAMTTGSADDGDMLARALASLPATDRNRVASARLELCLASGPHQQVIRPAHIEDKNFGHEVQREAMFGEQHAILELSEATKSSIVSGSLVLAQPNATLSVDESGTIFISQSAVREVDLHRSGISALVEEDLSEALTRGIRFGAWLLDRVDPVHRLTDVVPVARLTGSGYLGWRKRTEPPSNSVSVNIRGESDNAAVQLTPVRRHRQALTHDTQRIVEDLLTLLRRQRRA